MMEKWISECGNIRTRDVHVYDEAKSLGLTERRQKDITTATEITDCFREIFPDDPCLGDFALFGYGVTH